MAQPDDGAAFEGGDDVQIRDEFGGGDYDGFVFVVVRAVHYCMKQGCWLYELEGFENELWPETALERSRHGFPDRESYEGFREAMDKDD